MFLGTYQPRLDDKHRLFLPARFRDELAGGVVVNKGQDRCLNVWTKAEFARVTASLGAGSPNQESVRFYSRVFFASASEEIPDRQGRITLPQPLIDYAGLDRDCVVIGANTHLEIWDATAWATYAEASDEKFAGQAQEVTPGF